jgi:hypothetical protein
MTLLLVSVNIVCNDVLVENLLLQGLTKSYCATSGKVEDKKELESLYGNQGSQLIKGQQIVCE